MTQFSAQTHKAVTKPQEGAAGHVSRSGCRRGTSETCLDGFTVEENMPMDPCYGGAWAQACQLPGQ